MVNALQCLANNKHRFYACFIFDAVTDFQYSMEQHQQKKILNLYNCLIYLVLHVYVLDKEDGISLY